MFILSAVFLQSCLGDGGTRVVLKNLDDKPLHSVILKVTGNSYPLGELNPGETRVAKVYPTDESHLEVEHIVLDGQKRMLYVDCYIEPRAGGTIEVTLNSDTVVKVKHNRRQ